MNNKGFAITSIIYLLLLMFLVLVMGMLLMLGTQKTILDNYKAEILSQIEQPPALDDYVQEGLVLWYDARNNYEQIDQGLVSNLKGYNNYQQNGQGLIVPLNTTTPTASTRLTTSHTNVRHGEATDIFVRIDASEAIRGGEFYVGLSNDNFQIDSVDGESGFTVSSDDNFHLVYRLEADFSVPSGSAIASISLSPNPEAPVGATTNLNVYDVGVTLEGYQDTVSAGSSSIGLTVIDEQTGYNVFQDLANNNDGTLVNFLGEFWYENYLLFAGENEYVTTGLAADTFTGNDDFSLEAYFQIEEVNANNAGPANSSVLLGAFNNQGYGISWATYDEDDTKYQLLAGIRTSEGEVFTSGYEISDYANRIHVVMVYSNMHGELKFYVNGILIETMSAISGSYTMSSGDIGIGLQQVFDEDFLADYTNMKFYSARIYERALSHNEVIQNYVIDNARYQ